MYRTFDLARLKELHIGGWHSNIVNDVDTHLEHTEELRKYGYGKTDLSNAEKAAYYKAQYDAIRNTLEAIPADKLHNHLEAIDEMIRKVNVEFHNNRYLDTSVAQIEQEMTSAAKRLMDTIVSRMFRHARVPFFVNINEQLTAMCNKVSVQCGIIVYGMLEPIETICDESDADECDHEETILVYKTERDDAFAKLAAVQLEFSKLKASIATLLNQ